MKLIRVRRRTAKSSGLKKTAGALKRKKKAASTCRTSSRSKTASGRTFRVQFLGTNYTCNVEVPQGKVANFTKYLEKELDNSVEHASDPDGELIEY